MKVHYIDQHCIEHNHFAHYLKKNTTTLLLSGENTLEINLVSAPLNSTGEPKVIELLPEFTSPTTFSLTRITVISVSNNYFIILSIINHTSWTKSYSKLFPIQCHFRVLD